MLRFASSFVIATYDKVRLIPQDRERNPEARLAGRRGAIKNGSVPHRDMPPGGMSIARLACGLFTKPSHFQDLL
jgi:hypothetical protein